MDKRTKEIKIRLTENEHERLLARCDRAHLAEWLRSLGLGEHVLRRRRVPDVDPALLRQVTGIGNNLKRGNYPDKAHSAKIAALLRRVADDFDV